VTAQYRQPGVLEIDLGALSRNYRLLRRESAPSEVAAVVKANGYGLGATRVAARLFEDGCRHFFVATLAEGLALRPSLPNAAIYVFDGLAGAPVEAFVDAALTPVLNHIEDARRWSPTGRKAVLHADTGMSRLGMSAAEVELLCESADLVADLQIAFLMTHLACADDAENPLNRRQLELFEALRRRFPKVPTSIANSAGTFLGPALRGDLVRAGIALYGGNPFTAGRASPVEPVASLQARVLQIRSIDRSTPVGYGATYTAGSGDRIATVGVGYADGYPRMLGNTGMASANGVRVPVVGRVSMDLTALDVTSIPVSDLNVGQYVELFGRDVSVDEVAAACGTISYEILTGLGSRLERIYIE